jgi:lactate permease
MAGSQLALFSCAVPFVLVAMVDGWRGLKEVWPACLAMGGVFGAVQWFVSAYHGPWLVDLASSLASIAALFALLRWWQPAATAQAGVEPAAFVPDSRGFRAWVPWLFLSGFVFAWGLPAVRSALDSLFAPKWAVPNLHLLVIRTPPLVNHPTAEPAEFSFNLASATGTALLLAALATGFTQGLGLSELAAIYRRTVWRLRFSLATIAAMPALGFTTRYAGVDATIGLALASTGRFYPFFAPLIGWVGAALTGSDTSSNVLFGGVQQAAAAKLGLSPVLTAAANSAGGVMGKMIDAQSIVVASSAVAGEGADGEYSVGAILRSVALPSVIFAVLVGLFVWIQSRILWHGH